MAETRTKPTPVGVNDFIAAVPDPIRRSDGAVLLAMFERVTGEAATMWGPSIVGCGRYHYRYASGHEGDMCRVGFSPRSAKLVLYVSEFSGYDALLERLGTHKRSKGCLYINKLADVDVGVLGEIIRRSFEATRDVDQRHAG